MVDGKFTKDEITALKVMGWDFVPTGPNEYDWIKFDKYGTSIARGGSATWRYDTAHIADVVVISETWIPTMELRWMYPTDFVHFPALQQRWSRIEGESKWIDVPSVNHIGRPIP